MQHGPRIALADANRGSLEHTGRYLKTAFPELRLEACSEPEEFIQTLTLRRPEIAVLADVGRPKLLRETIQRVRHAGYRGGLVVLSIFEDFGPRACEAGADAFVPADQWRGLPEVISRLMPVVRSAA